MFDPYPAVAPSYVTLLISGYISPECHRTRETRQVFRNKQLERNKLQTGLEGDADAAPKSCFSCEVWKFFHKQSCSHLIMLSWGRGTGKTEKKNPKKLFQRRSNFWRNENTRLEALPIWYPAWLTFKCQEDTWLLRVRASCGDGHCWAASSEGATSKVGIPKKLVRPETQL